MNWLQACISATSRGSVYNISVSGSFAVANIVVFIISTVAAGTRFWQWWRLGDSRFKIWRFYGHFTFLMVTGSAFGVASSILYGNFAVAAFEVQDVQGASDEWFSLWGVYLRYLAAYSIIVYAEFILVTTAKLFVLDRMLSVVIAGRPPSVVRNWLGAGRIMLCLLALCHLIGVGAAITTTYFASQSALLTDSFATEHNGDRYAHYDMASQSFDSLDAPIQVKSAAQAAVLLLICAAFATIVVHLIARIRSLLASPASSSSASQLRHMQRQVAVSVAVVIISFMLRLCLQLFIVISNQGTIDQQCFQASNGSVCGNSACPMSQLQLMKMWSVYTPELALTIFLISEPVTLLVALWGMTTPSTLLLLRGGVAAAASETLMSESLRDA